MPYTTNVYLAVTIAIMTNQIPYRMKSIEIQLGQLENYFGINSLIHRTLY